MALAGAFVRVWGRDWTPTLSHFQRAFALEWTQAGTLLFSGGAWHSLFTTIQLAAIAAPITGFVALIGRAGIAFGPLVMLLFANPLSSANAPKEFLVAPWGEVGQWFPPGAAATLLRDLSYFPEADASFPWLVLGAWMVGGLLLSVVGHFRTAGGAESDAEAAVAV